MGIPKKDAERVVYSTNFDTQLSSSPETYNVSVPAAAAFTTIRKAYTNAVAALDESRATGVRSTQLTSARNSAWEQLYPLMGSYYVAIQSSISISDEAKLAIGVTPRKQPTRHGRPNVRPGMDVISVVDRQVLLNIHDSASLTKRARPVGTVQAFVYYFVGTSYPSDPALWSFGGAATTNKFSLYLPTSVPAGAQVWVCAAWTNKAGEAGPTSLPISVNIQGGGSIVENPAMKLAA